jgi:chromosomal replication initiator protein
LWKNNTMSEFSSARVQQVWSQACALLEQQVSPASYKTWILMSPLIHLEQVEAGKIKATLSCPTAFHAGTLQKNFQEYIQNTLMMVLEQEVEIALVVGTPIAPDAVQAHQSAVEDTPLPQPVTPSVAPSPPAPVHPPITGVKTIGSTLHQHPMFTKPIEAVLQTSSSPERSPSSHAPTYPTPSSPVPSHYPPAARPIVPPPSRSSTSPRADELFSPQTIQSLAVDRAAVRARQIGLRPDYTFETFAVSTSNEMAHAAATAVSNRPGTAYNPLFLYGGVGVGKTHLMHAIANNILKNNPDAQILYSTGEEFTNEIVNAIQTKKALKFKEKHRSVNVMLIDDVQFIAGKNAVQEEFFHTFNSLIKNEAQIVLTSDRPPHEINLLEDRLRSRFEAGLMIDIQQPSFELRTAILLIKAQAYNVTIPMDVAQLIASKVDSARKIEGVIRTLKSEVELKQREITVELAEELLKVENNARRPLLKVGANEVLRAVANHYHLKQVAIKGTKRTSELVQARHVAMYLLKEELKMSFVEIGRWFSNRDHTSAMHAVRKIEQEMQRDEMLQRDVSALRMSLAAVSR